MTTSYHAQMALAQRRARKHARKAIAAMKNGEEYGTARIIPDQAYIRKTIRNIYKSTVEGISDAVCQSNADRIFQQAYNQSSLSDEMTVWNKIIQVHRSENPDMDKNVIEEYAVVRLTKDFRRTKARAGGSARRTKKSNTQIVQMNSHVRKRS